MTLLATAKADLRTSCVKEHVLQRMGKLGQASLYRHAPANRTLEKVAGAAVSTWLSALWHMFMTHDIPKLKSAHEFGMAHMLAVLCGQTVGSTGGMLIHRALAVAHQ